MYSERLTITLPASLADIAAAIGRAMDSDVGGEHSFSKTITGYDADGLAIYGDTIYCTTPCEPAFKRAALAMLADTTGAMLHAAVAADYAARWPDLQCPTQDDCAAFVNGVIPEPVGVGQ